MGLFKWLFGVGDRGDLQRRLERLQGMAHEFARQESFELRVGLKSECQKIASACHIESKKDYKDFADVAVWLLAVYPKELICTLIANFAPVAGEPPCGKIIRAIANVNEVSTAGLPGTQDLANDPDTRPFLSPSNERTDKAAQTLAVALVIFAGDVKELKELWRKGIDNPEMQPLVLEQLWMMDSKLAQCLQE